MYLEFNGRKANLRSHQFSALSLTSFLLSFFSRFFSKFSAIALFVVFIVNVGWGQTTIASDGLNNSTTLFTLSGGSYYTGTTSSTADAPAFSAYAVEGTHSRGIANGTATLTSSNINTTGYSSIQMTFRLASYSVGSTSNGADGGDIVTVEVSPNGGTNYYSTVRVLGNSNARWSWSSGTGNASTAYDGNASSVDFTSGAGNATTTGYSAVTITSLPVTSNMRIRVTLLNDNGNERWLLDDFKVTGTASTFSVTYNANSASSGSVPSDATAYSSGSSVNTAANSGSLARTGYTFAGWNTAADGTGTTYAVSTSSAFTISSNTTLYARWTAAVTYDANGATSGSVPTDATAYRPGQAVTTSANSGTLARTGYTFAGWNTAADGMGTTYAVGTSSAFNISGNTTLYARWTASLTYDANSATSGSVPTDATAYRPGQAVSTASNSGSLARAGYSFAGWNTLADGTGTAYSVSTSNAFNISGNTTLYAQWTLISSPTIATSGTLSAVNTTYGTASASPTSFSVSGSALTNDITIMPPSGYEISTSLASGYENSLTLVQSGGSISSTTIYVRLAAITAVGSYSGNISLTSTGATTQNVATVSSVVSSKALNITGLTASNKVYDATTTASLTGTAAYGGLVNGESFSVSGTPTASFATKTVGTGKAVTVTGYTAPSANYTVTQPTGLTATITAKTVTITSAAVSNKTYDGTTSATISGTLSGVIAGDVVTLNGTGTFASANVGTGIVVTSSATLSGADAANYTLTQPTGIAANITSKSLTITANDVAKQYGSTLTGSSGSTAFTSSGLVVPETIGSVTISYGSGSAPGDAVGAYLGQVTPSAATSGTFNASNYTITYVSGTINVSLYAVGDFRTKQNGNWGTTSTWEKWNESAWVASTNVPDVSTANVLVLHTVDVNGSGTPPWNVNNLTVQSGGKLWCNSFTGNNDYIQVYGDILCDGTIGSIAGDDISFDIAGGNDCNISGTGSFTASRLRKDSDINTGQNSNVTIDMDVRLTWSSASGTVLYNNSGASSDFNVTINTGKNLRCSGPGSIACNVSIDGVDGTGSGNRGGTYTVHGTLDIDGALYSLNNNTSASARTTNAIVKSGGLIKCRYIETGTSGAAGNTLRIENGGKLMIFGSVDTITATLNDITWNGYSATNNTWDFQSGSTIEYSGATQQRLNGITTCSNFIVSGGGLKKLGNDFTVAGMLTLTSGRVQTDAYELIHSSTAASDLTHTTGSASFIYGIYRRYISSNTSTYELPVGLSSATSGYRRADFINNSLAGVTYIDASVRSISETGNNTDSRLSTTQNGSALTDVLGTSVWSLVPNAQPSVGTYGVNLYVANTGLSSTDDNTFCAVKRNDNSTDYADWSTFYASTTIPLSGAPGRMYDSGNGYAQRLGYSSFSEHALGKTPSLQPLPIELDLFEAFCLEKGKTIIKWSTATEHNTSHFQLDRSNNGLDWQALGSVGAAVNSDELIQYNFEDRNYGGLLYYRLHQVDLNGGEQLYGPISVNCEANVFEINTFPNPSGDKFNVSIYSETNLVSGTIQVLDAKGMVVYTSIKTFIEGSNEFEITSTKWLPGVYYIELIFEDGNMYRKKHIVM